MNEPIRINKYIASCGICSRRDADKLIDEGKVFVNGQLASSGQKVDGSETISVNGKVLSGPDKKVVLAFYKPVGITCTERDPHAEAVINDIVKYPVRVTYAGRLDKESEGLLLLTNDGELIDKMMRGANAHEKEYIVRVDKKISEDMLTRFEKGVFLKELDVTTRPAKVKKLSDYTFEIIISQGLNRQIRRMCQACNCKVLSLKRVRVVNVLLDKLKPGQFRELDEAEICSLREALN
ncbi:MAG: rRNA pseudouridine synthase [Lachnospiraceae bacterium]|nr:rRNA pseudouridine synthase [Lachnospiraceae bacterium]